MHSQLPRFLVVYVGRNYLCGDTGNIESTKEAHKIKFTI